MELLYVVCTNSTLFFSFLFGWDSLYWKPIERSTTSSPISLLIVMGSPSTATNEFMFYLVICHAEEVEDVFAFGTWKTNLMSEVGKRVLTLKG